jgi:hypothetical protein
MKRPAAWHEANDKTAKNTGRQGKHEDGDDVADGEVDDRTTSRAQRYVFENSLSSGLIPEDFVKRYKLLKSSQHSEAGKTKKANAIINSFVPRNSGFKGTIVPKTATIERVMTRESRNVDQERQVGYAELVFIGKVGDDSISNARPTSPFRIGLPG